MEFRRLELPGLVEIVPRKIGDDRGYFSEVFREDRFRDIADAPFVQENQSLSVQAGTIRGLHFQTEPFAQGKLVRCLVGAIYDVAVDLRTGSPRYGKWIGIDLTAEQGNQLWIPPGFAHGFCTLQPNSIVCYKVTAYYSQDHDKGVAWDDEELAVVWPTVADIGTLSAKDGKQPKLSELPHYFIYEG